MDQQLHPSINVATRALIPYYKIEQIWTKENKDEQKCKRKAKDIRMNISFIILKSERIVWIYTSCTLILGLAKERNNQLINTRIITDKDKIKVIHLYKEKN